MAIDQRTKTAYHEAGHASVAAALGVRVFKVTIVPSGTTNGMSVRQNCKWHPDETCAILLAGGLAVWELGWRRGEKLPDTCWGDLEAFDGFMRFWGAKDYDPERREEWDEYRDGERLALETLANYWGAVEAVANALLVHDTINGRLVHALVAAHKQRAKVEV